MTYRLRVESVRITGRRQGDGNIVAAGFSGKRYLRLQLLLFCSLNLAIDSPCLLGAAQSSAKILPLAH